MQTLPVAIWLALDVDNLSQAAQLVKDFHPHVTGFKVHASVEERLFDHVGVLRSVGAKRIWWDRKLLDSPETVARIAAIAKRLEIDRISVHAAGGVDMMKAAKKHGPQVVAITELSSLTSDEIVELSGKSVRESIEQKALWAHYAGIRHLVCPAADVHVLKRWIYDRENKVIAVGSHTLSDSNRSGQQRAASAFDAVHAGAHELVLGREITQAKDPLAAFTAVCCSISPSERVVMFR